MADATVDPALPANLLGYSQYDPVNFQVNGQTQFFDPANPLLSKAAGWWILFGLAAVFVIIASTLVWLDYFFKTGRNAFANTEHFQTAGRSINAGLIAVDVVSHWAWASVLLSAVTYGWLYGAAAAMYTSTCGVCSVWIFASLAIELKHKAPTAHTFLELVYVRWGPTTHKLFFAIGILDNLLVSVAMMQGAVVTLNVLTGVNAYAVCFIIPAGIAVYVLVGGLKTTFTTSYIHTVFIMVVCCILYFKVFAGSGLLGSIDTVYDNLQKMAVYLPAETNRHGSYLTGWSNGGLQLAVVTTFLALATIVADQSYWQSAVAAGPTCAFKGYFIGGLLYGAIMYTLTFSMGLATQALNLPVSLDEVFNGLAFAAGAYALLGRAGCWLTLLICYMAITSSGAGEMVGTSSLFTFDFYRRYINPQASGKRLLIISRIGKLSPVTLLGSLVRVAQTVVTKAEIPVFLVTLFPAVVLGGITPPVFMSLFWERCTSFAASFGCIFGNMCGTAAWITYAKLKFDKISATTLSANYSLLSGAVTSIGMSLLCCIVLTLMFPAKRPFQWSKFNDEISFVDDKATGFADDPNSPQSAAAVAKARRRIHITVVVSFFLIVIGWPLLTLPAGVWSKGYFTLMVVLFAILVLVGTMLTTLLPIWEAREYLFIIIAWLTSDKQGTPGRPSAFESGEMKRAQSAIPLKEVAPV